MKRRVLGLLLALTTFVTFGCGDTNDFQEVSGQQGNPGRVDPVPDPDPIPDPDPVPVPDADGFVRLALLSPNAPDVDVLVDGVLLESGVATRGVSDYLPIEAGTTRLQIRQTGTTTDLVDANVAVVQDIYQTVALTGLSPEIDDLLLRDDVTPTPGTLRVRFVNAVPGYGPLAVADGNLNLVAGPTNFNTASEYVEADLASLVSSERLYIIDPNNNNAILTVYNQFRDQGGDIITTLQNLISAEGANLTAVITGDPQDTTDWTLMVIVDDADEGGHYFIADPATPI